MASPGMVNCGLRVHLPCTESPHWHCDGVAPPYRHVKNLMQSYRAQKEYFHLGRQWPQYRSRCGACVGAEKEQRRLHKMVTYPTQFRQTNSILFQIEECL